MKKFFKKIKNKHLMKKAYKQLRADSAPHDIELQFARWRYHDNGVVREWVGKRRIRGVRNKEFYLDCTAPLEKRFDWDVWTKVVWVIK